MNKKIILVKTKKLAAFFINQNLLHFIPATVFPNITLKEKCLG